MKSEIKKSVKSAMAINQHNYEEFFLLYVDGELSAAEQQAVEQFVQANPGLADELELLIQMRLTDEPVVFDDKNRLFRNATTEISLNNYEEQFLLYIDNELDAVAKEKVETFVLQHPALQESFTVLKQIRLEPESIVFPDKKSLHKKEEKEKPVFYLRWQRIAVAAVLMGFIVLAWTLFPGNHLSNQTISKLEPSLKPIPQKNNVADNSSSVLPKTNQAITTVANQTTNFKQVINKNKTEQKNRVVEPIQQNENNLLAGNQTIEQPAGSKRESIVTNPVETIEGTQINQKHPNSNAAIANTDIVKVNTTEETNNNTNPLAQSTVYKELDTDDEKKSLYLGSLEINKDKLRGLFRKAGSLFRNKSKQEDEKTETASPSNTKALK